jgi:MFS family permease
MKRLIPLLAANALCLAAMMAFVAVIGPMVRTLGLAEWHGGLIVTLAGLAWMLLARVWGRASDRHGRKPVLIFGVTGFCLAYLALAVFLDLTRPDPSNLVVTLVVLSLIRGVIGGFYAAIPTCSAAIIADHTGPQERASGMAALGAANGAGMVLGPLAGGLLASFGLAVPLYFAALLPALALILLWQALPRTETATPSASPDCRLSDHRLRLPLIGTFLATSCVIAAQVCVGFLALDCLDLDPKEAALAAGLAMTAVGVTLILTQILVLRRKDVSSQIWLGMGSVIAALGFGSVALVDTTAGLMATYGVAACGMGMVFPALQAMAANAVRTDEQGVAAGTVAAAQGLAMVVAPLASAGLYHFSPGLPYIAAALILAGVGLMNRLHVQTAVADHASFGYGETALEHENCRMAGHLVENPGCQARE